MDGLKIQEVSSIYQSTSDFLYTKNVDENYAKTPRRGLGLMVNASKTPSCKTQSSKFQSVNRKTSRVPIYEVFEDVSDKECGIEETQIEEKFCNSPIEKVSRLSLGHDSFVMIKDLIDNDILHDDFSPLKDEPQQETRNCSSINVNIEEWEDYPPIEKVSRLDCCIENLADLYPVDDVLLCNNLEWVPHDEMFKQWTREEIYNDFDDLNEFEIE